MIGAQRALKPASMAQGTRNAIVAGGLGMAFVALILAPLIVALKLESRDRTAWRKRIAEPEQNVNVTYSDGPFFQARSGAGQQS